MVLGVFRFFFPTQMPIWSSYCCVSSCCLKGDIPVGFLGLLRDEREEANSSICADGDVVACSGVVMG